MQMACNSLQSGQYTGRQSSAMFKVPYGTLNKKPSIRKSFGGHCAGRPLEIGTENEQKLEDYLFVSGRRGLGRREILELTGEFLREENVKTRWVNDIPGFDWLRSFLKRHHLVTVRKDEVCSNLQVNPLDVYGFYEDLEHLYKKEKVTLGEAHRLYSLLETSLPCEEQSNNPVSDLLNASVFTCICADGQKLPPLVVFQGKCVTCENNTECNGALNKNQAEKALFCYWFEKIFIPMLPRSKRSIILFFDGQSFQINLRILQLAKRNSVFLVKFPPKLASHFQSMDLKCASALKSSYNAHLQTYKNENLQHIEDIQREKLGDIIGNAWKKSATKNIIVKGFERTGLFPLDKSKFDENVFSEPSLKQFKEWKEPEFKNSTTAIDDLQSGINEFETSADSADLQTPKITHVTSVASNNVTSSQHLIPIASKTGLLNEFPRFVPNESSRSNSDSKFEDRKISFQEESKALADEFRLNGPELTIADSSELTITDMLQDEVMAEVDKFNSDARRSERIFQRDASGGPKVSSLRKTI